MRLPDIPWTNVFATSSGHAVLPSLLLPVLLIGVGGCRGEQGKGPSSEGAEREVRVAAAADLKFAFDDVASEFRKKNPNTKVTVTYGSSGNFYAQLSNKAPFDLYLSADIDYPRKLIDSGLALKESEFLYAVGHIVVWVPNSSTLDLDKLGIKAVADPSVKKLAIASPKHAPYGRAAEAALKKLGVYEQVQDRLVLGENIAQTAQFVESGSADVGIVALSLAMAPAMRDKGRYWMVPLDAYPQLEQGGVILTWAKDVEATQALRTFVTEKEGRAILKQYGFIPPGE
jgi:molybdate transport system substrate-binding protein